MGNSTGKTTFPIRVRQIQGAEFTGLIFSIIEVLEGKTISEIIVSTTCKNLWLFNFVVLGSKKKNRKENQNDILITTILGLCIKLLK